MKIYTENLKKFSRLISQTCIRGNKFTESVYIDFDNNYLYFSHPYYLGRIKIKTDPFENLVNNFLVDTITFFSLVTEYSFININEKYEFSNNKEKFKLITFEKPETYEIIPFNYKESNWTEYILSEKTIINLVCAKDYMGGEKKKEYHGILLNKNIICSTDTRKIFRANIKENFNNIGLSLESLNFIREGYKITKKVSIFCNSDGTYCINIGDDDIEIIFPKMLNLKIPNLDDIKFRKKYDHPTYLIIEKQKLYDVLIFFESFVKFEKNEKLYFSIKNTNELVIEAKGYMTGNRILPLKECSPDLVDQTIMIVRFFVLKALESIDDKYIKIQIDENAPSFNIIGNNNKERNIILIKLVE